MEAKAILGLNASGKTRLVEQMRRQLSTDRLRYVAFHDSYGPATDRGYYLQQRWNQHDIDPETPLAGQLLERAFLAAGPDTPQRRQRQQQLYTLFNVEPLLDQYIILLSSGELRKFQLIKTLLADPEIIILDNPFIGLDVKARQLLSQLLETLVAEQTVQLILVVSRPTDIPPFVKEVVQVGAQECRNKEVKVCRNESVKESEDTKGSEEVVRLTDVTIRYGQRTILDRVNWTIRKGEHWSLSGPNGSGKSTLLSLICADNPQGYACDISLFGRQRGSGESIWDIKHRIGYVSPEMHRSYQRSLPAIQVVASGLKDTVGLYARPTPSEKEQCLKWMRVFGIEGLADRSFLEMSSGEQRLVLVSRAFVKEPPLLILDEPLHGLDPENRALVKSVINAYCQNPNRTLIMVTHYEEDLPSCIDHHFELQAVR